MRHIRLLSTVVFLALAACGCPKGPPVAPAPQDPNANLGDHNVIPLVQAPSAKIN